MTAGLGFTKLFSGIIHSTVWDEPMPVKIVWITMLAMADRKGRVMASIPGVANAARVTLEQAEDALAHLKAPDKYSRTKDHEGRRIEDIDGGWQLLNYIKYRELRDDDEHRMKVAARVAKHRAKALRVTDVTLRNGDVTPVTLSNHIEEEEEEEEEDNEQRNAAAIASADWEVARHELADTWLEKWPGSTPPPQLFKALKPLVKKHGWLEVKPRFREFLRKQEAQYVNPFRFAATWTDWQRSIPL